MRMNKIIEKEIGVTRFIGGEKKSFRWGETSPMINGAVFSVDENTAQTKKIELISKNYWFFKKYMVL